MASSADTASSTDRLAATTLDAVFGPASDPQAAAGTALLALPVADAYQRYAPPIARAALGQTTNPPASPATARQPGSENPGA